MSTQKYSKEYAIDALKFVAEEIGKSPSQREYHTNRKDHHPSTYWIKDNLNSWNNAKELAGLDINPRHGGKCSKEDCINALQSVAEEIGKSPSLTEYNANKKDHHPSVGWIHDNIGSWNYVKELAGLDVYTMNDQCTEEDAINGLQFVAEEVGKSPTMYEYMTNKKDHHPSVKWICNKLDGYNNAKERAGLDILNSAGSVEYSKKDAVDALKSVADEIGKSPSQREYRTNKKDHHPSVKWMQDNLSSWSNAKDTAGLKPCENGDGLHKDKESLVKKIKTRVQCKECGLREPNRKLHFHHVEPDTKVNSVGIMTEKGYSMEELKTEIKKCEILCETCHGHKHSKTVTKEDCINALQWVVDQLGYPPTQREYQKHKKDNHPNMKTIRKHFNSWSNAKETVNLESTQTTLHSDFAFPSRNDE